MCPPPTSVHKFRSPQPADLPTYTYLTARQTVSYAKPTGSLPCVSSTELSFKINLSILTSKACARRASLSYAPPS
eukprot:scaffold313041_cov16-Prasinocladus_malaysianus.AAC.1